MRSAVWVLVLVTVVTVSGCVADPGVSSSSADETESSLMETVEEIHTFDGDPPAGVFVPEQTFDMGWSLDLTGEILDVEAQMTWERPTNTYGLEIATPGGEERVDPPSRTGDESVETSVPDPQAGTYKFRPVAEGAEAPDTLHLTVFVTRRTTGDVASSSVGVDVERRGDGWYAEVTYADGGPAAERMNADVDTANGEIDVSAEGDDAAVVVTAWARASTRDEAVERARAIDVTADVDGEQIVGRAEADDWDRRGAHVDVEAPTVLSGTFDTSNGPVTLDGLDAEEITVQTSNGPIEATGSFGGPLRMDSSNGQISGEVDVSDDLTAHTSNGPVELAVDPQGSLTLDVQTSNGPIELGLQETSEIAYELGAQTSNGEITEDMEEAYLEGSDTQATLRTEDGEGRPIQVQGQTSTSNGPIHFQGR